MIHIREAKEEDIPRILQFVKELAVYEHLENEAVATFSRMAPITYKIDI